MIDSRAARRAVRDLRIVSKVVQRSGAVVSSRKIDASADELEAEVERLEQERAQLIDQIQTGRAGEQDLMAEVVALREALADCEDSIEDVDGDYE